MKRLLHTILITITSFLALTAIAGGVGLLSGLLRPPEELLAGSPFGSYLVPGLSLTILVGGTALLSTIALMRNHPQARILAFGAAISILIFEAVEILVIGSPEGIARNLQILYFSTGGLIMILAVMDSRLAQAVSEDRKTS